MMNYSLGPRVCLSRPITSRIPEEVRYKFRNRRTGDSKLCDHRLHWIRRRLGTVLLRQRPYRPPAGLYASRIITGVGIGGLTVTGPVSIVEIAPAEIRGLLTSWYGVCMGLALFCSIFCVYGMYLHVPAGPLQYQVVFFAPCVFMLVSVAASFWICESPRWLVMMGRHEDAVVALTRLRGLPVSHPRLESEIIYAMGYGTPSLLETTGDWGAFIFFACWCFVALCYVYFMVPEIAGMSVEEVDNVFKTSWFTAYKRPERPLVVEGLKDVNVGRVDTSDGKQSHQYSP